MAHSRNNQVVINIKITRIQRDWLAQTASLIRDNNENPVLPEDRVFPQHLIGVAINLLSSQDINWDRIKNTDDLRRHLDV
jgi:hypothetical protein